MAKESKAHFWQICMTCNRRKYSNEIGPCECGARMIDALEHPDNAHRKEIGGGGHKPKPASTPTVPPA